MTSSTAPASGTSASARRMQVGIAGLGAGAVQVIRAMAQVPYIQLIAAADVRPEALATFTSRFQGRTYASVEELCRDPEVEVVWISSPNRFHGEHTILAANHGKHVVVEKPMAINLDEARAMVEAAERNGVKLLAGHTRAFTSPLRAMRRVIESGKLGALRAVNVWAYSDWILRPRTADELDLAQGGGVPYRQGPHQVDTVRLLGGGLVRSVRAQVGQWLPGGHSRLLRRLPGVRGRRPATIVHNGYGYFLGAELVPWVGSPRYRAASTELRWAIGAGQTNADQEALLKNEVRFGGSREAGAGEPSGSLSRPAASRATWVSKLRSCARGDVRQSPNGLWVYDDDGQREVPVEGLHDERLAELDEMYQALTTGR